MQAARLATRLQRELRMLQTDPPPGVCAWPCNDSLSHLEAQIQGPDGTVYSKGLFKLEVHVPERYPFEPPSVRFKTPIYHPNIDNGGRICLDILNMPPKGAWKPSLNIPTVLASIGLLLAEPNPDDGLMGDITAEYKHNRFSFDMTATKWTQQYALPKELPDGVASARSTQPEVLEANTSSIPNKVQIPAPASSFGLQSHATQHKEGAFDPVQVQTSVAKAPTANKKVGKLSGASHPKLNLGVKLSLEKGGKDMGKQGSIGKGPAEGFAVLPTRTLSSIDNIVGSRQVIGQQIPPVKGSVESSIFLGEREDTGTTEAPSKENLCVRTRIDGKQPKGAQTGCSIDILKTQRPREDQLLTLATDTQAAKSKQQKRCLDVVASISDNASHSKSSSPTADSVLPLKPEEGDKRESHPYTGFKARDCVTSSSHHKLEKLLDLEPDAMKSPLYAGSAGKPETCSWSLKQKSHLVGRVDMAEADQDPYQSTFSSGLNTEIGKTAERSHMKPVSNSSSRIRLENLIQREAKQMKRTSIEAAGFDVQDKAGKCDQDTAVILGNEWHSQATRVTLRNSDPDQNAVKVVNIPSAMVKRTVESQTASKSASSKTANIAVEIETTRKPPKPVTPAVSDIIVLDSESDDEPPKVKSKLSLSRRKGVKRKH